MKLLLKPFKFCIIIFLLSYFFQFFTPNLLFADNIDSKRSIRVGIFQNEPIVFQDEGGVAKGLYVDIMNEIAKKENWNIEYVLDSFSGGLDRLKTNDIDIMACVTHTLARDTFADFSGEAVWTFWGTVFVQPGSQIEDVLSLQGKKVAILKNGINGINFLKLCHEFNVTCAIQEMSSFDITLKSVESGESDAAVVNNIFGAMHSSEYEVDKTSIIFSPLDAVFAFPEGKNRDLANIIDAYLHEWKQDKNSTYNLSLARWLMQPTITVSVVPYWLIAGVTILLFIALLLLIWTRQLKRIVSRRTAQLQRSRIKYQSLFDNSPDMYVSVSPDNAIIQECNETLLQNTGYSREEVIESPIFEMYHEDCMYEAKNTFQQLIETGIIKDKELTLKRKDGSKIEVSLNVTAVKNDSGEILYSISSWRDISDRNKNERLLKQIADNYPNSYLSIINKDYTIGFTAGQEFQRQNLDPKQFIGLHIKQVFGEHYEFVKGFVDKVFADKEQSFELFINDQHQLYHMIPLKSDDDKISRILSVSENITERKEIQNEIEIKTTELENQLIKSEKHRIANLVVLKDLNRSTKDLKAEIIERKQAEKKTQMAQEEVKKLNEELERKVLERTNQLKTSIEELEAFSYSVSHDLRAPLRAINSFTKILVEDYSSHFDEEGLNITSISIDNAIKMGQLIDDLLAFSKIGRASLRYSNFNSEKLVQSIYNEVTNPKERTRIDFQIHNLIDCPADNHLMKVVWTNLILNAIKFSARREKALIEIFCTTDKQNVVYHIKDNGAGFDMKYIDKLFGVFQRLHTDEEFSGTGVGLALIKRIVSQHKGQVWAKSEIDAGAEFSFSLPVNE
jgi:PAS domain S-box-containing protein